MSNPFPSAQLAPPSSSPHNDATKQVTREEERQAQHSARLLRALSDPTRLLILQMLSQHPDTLTVADLTGRFRLQQPTISHHLRILRDAGFLECGKKGLYAYYTVRRERVEDAQKVLQDLQPLVEQQVPTPKQPAYHV